MKTALCFLIFGFMLRAFGAAPVVENHPQKDLILQSLQRLVDERSKEIENHFFFLKRNDEEHWVYWREGRLLWNTVFDPYYEQKGPTEIRARSVWDLRLRTPRKPIDLDTGVVPSPKDIGTSTYLVSKDYVAEIVYDCVQDGELVVVRKKRPNKAPEPTRTSVTPRAGARVAPAARVAHL